MPLPHMGTVGAACDSPTMTSDDHPNPPVGLGEIAWCAGVVDAIGLVRQRELKATGSLLAYVGVSTAHLGIAERLAELTGTRPTIVRRNYNRLGCSAHCTEPHQHVNSVTARWSLTGARARVFLQAVRPMLALKGQVVDETLWATQDAPFKPAVASKMVELGWPIETTVETSERKC